MDPHGEADRSDREYRVVGTCDDTPEFGRIIYHLYHLFISLGSHYIFTIPE
jgi:hypothetical protein